MTTKTKKLSLAMATALVTGNMIGSGIFLLPASLARYGGISLVGWLFTSAGAVLLALLFADLSRRLPRTGGPYTYSREGLGDFAGFWIAWGYWISILAGNAGIATALVGYLSVFIPVLQQNSGAGALTALLALWLLTGVNLMQARVAGGVQLVTLILKILPLLVVAAAGAFYFRPEHFHPFNLSGQPTFQAVSATAALTLWAFLGLESATVPAGKIADPERNIPRATLFGTILAAVVYIAGSTAVLGMVNPGQLQQSPSPFAEAARLVWGDAAQQIIAVAAIISCLGALNGWILLQGQIPFATARDKLFPAVFGRQSRNGAPAQALVISSILVSLLIGLNYTKSLVSLFTFLILLSAFTSLVPYLFCAAAEFVFLGRGRHNAGWSLKLIATGAFLYSLWAVAGAGKDAVFWGVLLLLAGLPFYAWLKPAGRNDVSGRP